MTVWTVEWLDALPEGTVIECDLTPYPNKHEWFVRIDGDWEILRGMDVWASGEILSELASGSIRVVSVPVAALLSDEVIDATARAETAAKWNRHTWDNYPDFAKDKERGAASSYIRTAIGHVTGAQD